MKESRHWVSRWSCKDSIGSRTCTCVASLPSRRVRTACTCCVYGLNCFSAHMGPVSRLYAPLQPRITVSFARHSLTLSTKLKSRGLCATPPLAPHPGIVRTSFGQRPLTLQVRLRIDSITRDPPATCDDGIQRAAADAASALGLLKTRTLPSHAYHDSLFMAQFAPTGMLFIPCFKGYSHRPDEFASGPAMAAGTRALALTLAALAGDAAAGTPPGDASEL